MWLDGMEIPGWLRPWVGWVVGSDWPQADEQALFRLADGLVSAAGKLMAGHDGAGARLPDALRGEWDGKALKAFAARMEKVHGNKAALVRKLILLALGLNQLGVQ